MKSDLDTLMKARKLDAILVLGNAENNPSMYYLMGGGHVSNAAVLKVQGKPAVVYCNAMEREEAAKSGLEIVPLRFGVVDEFFEDADVLFKEQGLTAGRVGLLGKFDVGTMLALLERFREIMPDIKFVGELKDESLLLYAMETKDEAEVSRIRQMGAVTTAIVDKVKELLTSSDVREDEVLLKEDGTPLTVGDVHTKIRLWALESGVELPDGFIFSTGRDAGIPHSIGTPENVMKLGETIVFDIYPAEMGGGYYYDFTRTWSLGYATPEAQKLYDEVKDVYDKVIENIDLNVEFKEYQKMTCDEFHKLGHLTPMHKEDGVLMEGYVHSLGHGVGLNIHERPHARHTAEEDNRLKPGVVITIEPGLYYPDRGMGFRIEDTYWVRPDGQFEKLAEYPYDFVLPMKKWKK